MTTERLPTGGSSRSCIVVLTPDRKVTPPRRSPTSTTSFVVSSGMFKLGNVHCVRFGEEDRVRPRLEARQAGATAIVEAAAPKDSADGAHDLIPLFRHRPAPLVEQLELEPGRSGQLRRGRPGRARGLLLAHPDRLQTHEVALLGELVAGVVDAVSAVHGIVQLFQL